MNSAQRFFTLTWLSLFVCYISVISAEVRIFNVGDLCIENSTVDLRKYNNGILKAEVSQPVDCEILLGEKLINSVVISLYKYDLRPSDTLLFRDVYGTELSLSHSGMYHKEERSFLFEGPLQIHFVTNITRWNKEFKFEFTFTESHSFACKSDEFRCNNEQCVPSIVRCNNHNNCGDRSDERNCTDVCSAEEFMCNNRKCIPKFKLCDFINDCGDFSDERNCPEACSSDEFKCNNNKCIPKFKLCDGRNDCGDYSDETNCHGTCGSNEFKCKTGKCVGSYNVCDGRNDCGDWSDEADCYRECLPKEFLCRNRKCIPKFFVCDTQNDCGDMSDERNCGPDRYDKTVLPLERNPWLITIIVCGAIVGLIVTIFSVILIRRCVIRKKKPTQGQLPTVSGNVGVQQVQPPNLFGRIRQSFRSARPSAPPSQPPNAEREAPATEMQNYQVPSMYPQLRTGVDNAYTEREVPARNMQNYQGPSMYPHLQTGVDNPEFKIEE